jgi:ABC-type sulfate transport system substrate-binding protein
MERRICCVICHTETDVATFNRRHERNGLACVLANADQALEFAIAHARWAVGNHWSDQSAERVTTFIRSEQAKMVQRHQRLTKSA